MYNTSNDLSTLRIVIYNEFCNDGMSDNTYNNRVRIIYNGAVYQGCGILF
jgi:uncharacterized membrane protein